MGLPSLGSAEAKAYDLMLLERRGAVFRTGPETSPGCLSSWLIAGKLAID